MRSYGELPRMLHEAKAGILGAAAAGVVSDRSSGKRVQKSIDEKGHPFAHGEAKPLPLWQRVLEHRRHRRAADIT